MNELVAGLKNLKTGAMVSLISIILALVSVVLVISSVGMVNPGNPKAFLLAMSAMGSFVVILIAAVVLGIVGFVLYFMATGHLSRYDPRLGIGRWGMTLQIVGLILVFVPVILIVGAIASHAILSAILASIGLMVLGGLLIIVGAILFGIMLIRLGEDPNVDSGFKMAGIIYLVGIILSFVAGAIGEILGIVTTILIYISAKNSLERLGALG